MGRIVNTTCMYGDKLYIGTDTGLQIVNSDNREGFDCTVNFRKEDNKITVTTTNAGIFVKSVSIINDKTEHVYASLTGDQVILTNIRIS